MRIKNGIICLCIFSFFFLSCTSSISDSSKDDAKEGYTVRHYLQTVEGDNYVEKTEDAEFLPVTSTGITEAQPKNYTGFSSKAFDQKKIEEKGKTTVIIYYDRNIITYTFESLEDGSWNTSNEQVITGRYGAQVNKPSDPLAKHPSYIFDKWNNSIPEVFGEKDEQFTALYKYNFYEKIEVLKEGSDGTAGTTGTTYVYFGVWPQTIKAPDVEVDESNSISMGGHTYYLGNDNNYYAKTIALPYSSYEYKCAYNQILERNKEYYFKVEPIKWRVVTKNYNETGTALLLAEDTLRGFICFYYDENAPSRHYKYTNQQIIRTINGVSIYPNNYKYSTIRAYLNGVYEESDTQKKAYENSGFLQTAFTHDAQELINLTRVDNSVVATGYETMSTESDEFNSFRCSDTYDKVFLLSITELLNPEYCFSVDGAYLRKATDFAKATCAMQRPDDNTGNYWRLRTPYVTDPNVVNTETNVHGTIANTNLSERIYMSDGRIDAPDSGIVPALTVNLSCLQ